MFTHMFVYSYLLIKIRHSNVYYPNDYVITEKSKKYSTFTCSIRLLWSDKTKPIRINNKTVKMYRKQV